PGEGTSCSGDTTLMVCGPDNVSLVELECTGSCFNDACDNRPNHCPYDYDVLVNCGADCGELTGHACVEDLFGPECLTGYIPGEVIELGEKFVVRSPNAASACSTSCEEPKRRFVIMIYKDRKSVV